jgi:hypothetical protein
VEARFGRTQQPGRGGRGVRVVLPGSFARAYEGAVARYDELQVLQGRERARFGRNGPPLFAKPAVVAEFGERDLY